jgi:hypothetical protein
MCCFLLHTIHGLHIYIRSTDLHFKDSCYIPVTSRYTGLETAMVAQKDGIRGDTEDAGSSTMVSAGLGRERKVPRTTM